MSEMEQSGVRILAKGRVQGVCFRAYTRDQARELNVSGWVKNLPDGRVEILAEGSPRQLKRLVAWCREGPPWAVVQELKVESVPFSGAFDSFSIRY